MHYNSKIREAIKEVVLTTFTHPTAEDVYLILVKKGYKTSVSTVYRNLHQLSEENIIKEIVMPNGKTHYDGKMINHQHAYCIKCNQIFDIETNIEKLDELLSDLTGMKIVDKSVIIRGVCEKCQNKLHKEEQ